MRRTLLASTAIRVIPAAYNNPNIYAPYKISVTQTGMLKALVEKTEQLIAEHGSVVVDDPIGSRDIVSEWMLKYWDTADDVVAGYDAVRAGEAKYLPKFKNEEQDEYDTRLGLTEFTNVFRDIVETLAAKPFEEKMDLKTEDGKKNDPDIEEFIKDVDGAANDITAFMSSTFFNGIAFAIDWIFVDYPKVDTTIVRSIADSKANGIRPYWSHVLGRNVLEATAEVINGKETLVKMRILEPGTPNHVRMFERYPDGSVLWGLFEEQKEANTGRKRYILVDSGDISIGEIPLVPFITGRRAGRTFKIFPAMRDALDLQIQLYRQESGLNYSKVMAAYPMLAANGINPEVDANNKPKTLRVGPGKVLWSRPDGSGNSGSWAYVEPDAQLLKFLEDSIKNTMDQLRELGKQPLTAQSGNLTVVTTTYAAGKSKSAVGAWGIRASGTADAALALTCKWLGINDYEPHVKIYDEYDDFNTDQAADLSALKDMRKSRDISRVAYVDEMKRRNVLKPEYDAEADLALILAEVPVDDGTQDDTGAGGNNNNAGQ